MSRRTESEGINVHRFYDNPSYFAKTEHGKSIAWTGSHPTLIHYPLADYIGGPELCAQLTREVRNINGLVGDEHVRWIKPQYWHSTVFSAVHSGNPDVISQSRDISDVIAALVSRLRPYVLVFSRIIITSDGGIIATAYSNSTEPASLREKLREFAPAASASRSVHITLGHLTMAIPPPSAAALIRYGRKFLGDARILGQLKIDFLTYGLYHGPFLSMRVESLVRIRFGSGF
jgi:hypothetical protein